MYPHENDIVATCIYDIVNQCVWNIKVCESVSLNNAFSVSFFLLGQQMLHKCLHLSYSA